MTRVRTGPATTRSRARRFFLSTLGALSLPCPSPAADADVYTLRMAQVDQVTDSGSVAALRFAAAAARRSNGRLKIEVYPNGQLVNGQDTFNALANGVIDLTIMGSQVLTDLVPAFQVFDVPFLFRNLGSLFQVWDGPLGAEFFSLMEPRGMVGLAWATNGFRDIMSTSKAIVVPGDMKGLRVRTPGGPVYAAMYQALGAIPVTIDSAEIFVALQQHTVDALDLPVAAFANRKYYTIVKHATLTNHTAVAFVMACNKRKLESLPPDLQRIVREEAKPAARFMRTIGLQQAATALQTIRDNGVMVTDIQYAAYRKLMDPVFASVQARIGGDLLERVSRVAGRG